MNTFPTSWGTFLPCDSCLFKRAGHVLDLPCLQLGHRSDVPHNTVNLKSVTLGSTYQEECVWASVEITCCSYCSVTKCVSFTFSCTCVYVCARACMCVKGMVVDVLAARVQGWWCELSFCVWWSWQWIFLWRGPSVFGGCTWLHRPWVLLPPPPTEFGNCASSF